MKSVAVFLCLLALTQAATQIQLEFFTESLCPYCQQFIVSSLSKAIKCPGIYDMANFSIYTYGNAQERQSGGQWIYTCQHGPQECYGNVLESCAKHYYNSNTTFWSWIVCMETAAQAGTSFDNAGTKCSSQYSVDWTNVKACGLNATGNALEHAEAVVTNDLSPAHQYVPWVVTNGQHNVGDEEAILTDMLKWVCDHYDGEKASCCP